MRHPLFPALTILAACALALPLAAVAASPGTTAATISTPAPTGTPLPARPADPVRVAFEAAVALVGSRDTVFVDPSQARVFTRVQADQIRGKIIRAGGWPIYVVVLPGNALGDDGETQLKELTLRLGYNNKASIAVVTGGKLRAASTAIPYALAQQFADQAIAANDGEPLEVTIADWIGRLAKEEARDDSGGGGGVITGVISTIVVFGGGGILLLRRRRRWRELNGVRALVEADLEALARELVSVPEPEATSVRSPLERASRSFRSARGVEHLPHVAGELAAARRALVIARSELDGEVPPAETPPCFFDSRHGSGTTEVEWDPGQGRAPRLVHCCPLDVQRIANGLAPVAREVELAEGTSLPWFEATPSFRYYLAPGARESVAGLPAGAPLRASRWIP